MYYYVYIIFSYWRSIRLTPAFSTPVVYSRIFHSCIFHLCCLLLHFPLLHFPPLQFWPYRIFHSRVFSRPVLRSLRTLLLRTIDYPSSIACRYLSVFHAGTMYTERHKVVKTCLTLLRSSARAGGEPATSQSQVRRPNHCLVYTTAMIIYATLFIIIQWWK